MSTCLVLLSKYIDKKCILSQKALKCITILVISFT